MDAERLKEILNKHRKWLEGQPDGERANLQGANLQGANLQGAYLQGAYLQGAYLQGAYLQEAYLRGAYLQGADLQGADLRGAYLRGADLRGANLQDIQTDYLTVGLSLACPETGPFLAWKRVGHDCLAYLEIPDGCPRSSATTAKCRAERALVLRLEKDDGTPCAAPHVATSDRGGRYKAGEYTVCDKWDPDRWNECSGGIHFFLSRDHALAWN